VRKRGESASQGDTAGRRTGKPSAESSLGIEKNGAGAQTWSSTLRARALACSNRKRPCCRSSFPGKCELNISSGEKNYGEDFHLPNLITRSPFYPDQDYVLLNANVGFYSGLKNEKVFKYFPNKNNYNSSQFRLFGCAAANDGMATPTLVIGDVWRQYVQAAGIARLRGTSIGKVIQLPWGYNYAHFPRDVDIPPYLFMSKKFYQIYMSQVREEPYNRSFDFVMAMGKMPTPLYCKSIFKKRFGDPYPCFDKNIEIKRTDGEVHYSGNLKYFNMKNAIYKKTTAIYDTLKDFININMIKVDGIKVLKVDGVSYIKDKKINLKKYSPLTVSGKGILLVEGKVIVGNIGLDDPKKDMFSIVQLSGNMYIAGNKIHAYLSTTKGHIILQTKVNINGGIAAKYLTPNEIMRGGLISYDTRYDPESKSFFDYYTIALKSRSDRVWER
jgi:hypothetical protein